MNVLSLFNGISCGKVALERAKIKVNNYISFEIDEFANNVAMKNYPNDIYLGDVFNADFTKYKDYDLLIGGSPCTYWSNARAKNTGREITPDGLGGQLFMQYYRALKESNCKYFIYENNNSMSKNIKIFITEKLGVQPILINSNVFIPQTRRRLYWTNIPVKGLPKPTTLKLIDYLQDNVSDKYTLSKKMTTYAMSSGTKNFYVKPEINLNKARPLTTAPNKRAGTTTYISVDFKQSGNSTTIRRLTPVEFERLQTLPDNYSYINGHKFEDSRRYKAVGNSWTVDVIAHILSFIKLRENNEQD